MSNKKETGFGVSDLIQGGLELLKLSHDEIVRRGQTSIEAYLGVLSIEVDKAIKSEHSAGLKFISGETIVSLVEDNSISTTFDLYFKDVAGAWVKKTISSRPVKMEWILLPDEQSKIRNAKSFKFLYESP